MAGLFRIHVSEQKILGYCIMQVVQDLTLLLNAIFFGLSIFIALILWNQKTTFKKANRILSLLLIAFAITTLNTLFILTGYSDLLIYYQDISNAVLLTIGPSIYLFIKARIAPISRWQMSSHYVPFLLYGLVNVLFILLGNMAAKETVDNITFLILLIQLILYILASFFLLNQYQNEVKDNFSNIEKHDINWIKIVLTVLLSTLVLRLVLAWYTVAIADVSDLVGLNLTLVFAIATCYLGYKIFKNPELFVQLPSYSTSNLSSQELQGHIKNLKEVMKAKHLYRNPKLTISDLAQHTGLRSRVVSQTLNQELSQNFFDYVNSFRVADLQEKLQDPENKHFKLQVLMNDAGFQSPSVAYTAFKKATGTTPAQFRKRTESLLP